MATRAFSGVVYGSNETGLVHLPLDEVKVRALVIDGIQVFSNLASENTPRAKYVFPVPARSAVCAFEMHTEDGRMIRGIAKERQQAKEEHVQALNDGKLTSLVEWATDDIFTISVGSVPAGQSVTTHLTYVLDLMNNDIASQIRLQLPMSVGQRYGMLPAGMEDASGISSRTRIRITIVIQTRGAIRAIASPTHPRLSVIPYETHRGRPSRHRMIAKFRSHEYLMQDFVLTIEAEGLDVPRCFAECGPAGSGTVALQLTMVPNFQPLPLRSKEYIFLVDRSGSMSEENRMEIAKSTLVMLLHSLPKNNTFNIFSFGEWSDSLFATSQVYSETTLFEAVTHVDRMSADYRTTEIRAALEHVFRSRNLSLPTEVFVLTDGEVYDDSATSCVLDAVRESRAHAPLHVFVLGIGDTASSAMCQGIADAGRGVYLMTTSSEDILGKSASLVRAGRTSFLKNITIDWGLAHRDTTDGGVRFIGDEATIRQAPPLIESIYPGHRFITFAIVKHDQFVVPKEIVIHGERDGRIVDVRVAVEQAKFPNELPQIPLIHTLAARQLVTCTLMSDIEAGQTLTDEQKRASVIRLGEQYQLATRYTSFVAIEDHIQTTMGDHPRISRRRRSRDILQDSSLSVTDPPSWTSYLSLALDYATSLASAFVNAVFRPWVSSFGGNYVPSEDPQETDAESHIDGSDEDFSDDYSTMSSLLSYTESEWSDEPVRPLLPPLLDPNTRSPSPHFERDQTAPLPGNGPQGHVQFGAPASAHPPPVQSGVFELVRLQSFDGSFAPTDDLGRLIGADATTMASRLRVDPKVWATALAVVYLRKHLRQQPELLDGLLEKAMQFMHETEVASGVHLEALLERARTVVI
ncbi:unnamed protein product [Somion occarium]|uniref:Uncharacterized protein n=1 Tax=Somion occarium TaxID=3059160 RepID=A0ABP1DQP0_9APHY